MRSVADDLRTATRRATADMTAEQRVDLALQLGDDDLKSFATANGLSAGDARRELERRRHTGRRPSACVESRLR